MKNPVFSAETVAFFAATYFRDAGHVVEIVVGGEPDTATVTVEYCDERPTGDTFAVYEFRGPETDDHRATDPHGVRPCVSIHRATAFTADRTPTEFDDIGTVDPAFFGYRYNDVVNVFDSE